MMKWWLAVMALAGLAVLAGWAWLQRPAELAVTSDLRLHGEIAAGSPAGNLVAIQPWLDARDYQSAAHLQRRLGAYLEAAHQAGALPAGSVVVFPEHVGTWLVAAGAPAASFTAASTGAAMAWIIAADAPGFAAAWLGSAEEDRAAAAVFRMRARAMAADYQAVFSGLARDYAVTVVAGSVVLPEPSVAQGRLLAGDGPLFNTAAVFGPDGAIAPQLVRKVHPIPDEAGFTAASPDPLPVFTTPAGRLGVLICADSWHPDVYADLRAGGAEIVAVPAFLQPGEVWDAPWHGYTTGWPDDVDPDDAGRLSEAEAWLAHALGGRMGAAGARVGATAFLRGELWDLGSDGGNILVDGAGARIEGHTGGAAVSVLPLAGTGAASP